MKGLSIYNKDFFNNLKYKWLSTLEVYTLLKTISKLIVNRDIVLTSNIDKSFIDKINNISQSELSSYYFIPYKELSHFLLVKNYSKKTQYTLNIKNKNVISCYNFKDAQHTTKAYFLNKNPEYVFIHCRRNILHLEKIQQNISATNVLKSPIGIIDFNPEYIVEETENQKLFLVIESGFKIEELENLSSVMSICFGDKFVKYNVVSSNVLCCKIPPQSEKEVLIDLYISNKCNGSLSKISYYNQENKKTFKYLKKPDKLYGNLNANLNKQIFLFNFEKHEIYLNIINLISFFMKHITFFDAQKEKKQEIIEITMLISKLSQNFTEINLNNVLKEIFEKLKILNKTYLINTCDESGYNLLHYIAYLNYVETLNLMSKYDININEKSKDGLTTYEICAEKRNLQCLENVIQISEKNEDNADLATLKNALNLLLDREAINYDDLQMLNLLLKQIKIKYTIDSISGKILDKVKGEKIQSEKGYLKSDMFKKRNIQKIQRAVRGWLKRNKYKSIKTAANILIDRIKNYCERKRFLTIKNSTIFIQHEIRKFLKEKKQKNKNNN